MLEEIDVLDFLLAQDLGMSLTQVRALPNTEHVEWRAFYEYRAAMQDFLQKEANRRG
jgi:hypothetical protein